MQTKDFKFDLKSADDTGTFEGYLSVFNVEDQGGDLVEPGAFRKTIKDRGGVFTLLWQHDHKSPIGTFKAEEDAYGLKIFGRFILAVKQAQEAYELLKAGALNGLSIGFKAIQDPVVSGVRHLKEVKLYEGSLVTFPMCLEAQVSSVKSIEEKDTFAEVLERSQVYAMRHMMMEALCSALDSSFYRYGPEYTAEFITNESKESIAQFSAAYMEHLPKLLELYGIKGWAPMEAKAGRRISAATRMMIEEAITKLQALLETEESTSDEAADSSKSIEPPIVKSEEPASHSRALFLIERYKLGLAG